MTSEAFTLYAKQLFKTLDSMFPRLAVFALGHMILPRVVVVLRDGRLCDRYISPTEFKDTNDFLLELEKEAQRTKGPYRFFNRVCDPDTPIPVRFKELLK